MSSRIIDARSDLADDIATALAQVNRLRRELNKIRPAAINLPGGDLIDLDIGRALAALFDTRIALERAGRHARLEP